MNRLEILEKKLKELRLYKQYLLKLKFINNLSREDSNVKNGYR